jgi:hypothetical protein
MKRSKGKEKSVRDRIWSYSIENRFWSLVVFDKAEKYKQ